MADIQSLGAQIAQLSETLALQLRAGNHPKPTFTVDGPGDFPRADKIQSIREQLIESARDLLQLASGPADYFFSELCIHEQFDLLHVELITSFEFFSKVPIDGGASYAELAKATTLPEQIVRRVLPYCFAMHIFAPDGPDRVVHTAFSAYVARTPLIRSWICMSLEDTKSAGMGMTRALRHFTAGREEPSQEVEEAGFSMAFPRREDGSAHTLWSVYEEQPWRAERFAESMQVTAMHSKISADISIEQYDWEGLGKAAVIDVGGSDGHHAAELARNHPNLSFVVRDLAQLHTAFQTRMAKSTDVADRVAFEAHDFFRPQQLLPGGQRADVIFIKNILHNWPDKYCLQILRNMLPALKPGGRILICEMILPSLEEAEKLPLAVRKLYGALDLMMLNAFNASERTREAWERMVKKADEGLQLASVYSLPGARVSLLEVAFEG